MLNSSDPNAVLPLRSAGESVADEAAPSRTPHISVCLCTFKRPDLLKRLLESLRSQQTGGLFTYSIVVADNDRLRSAESLVTETAAMSHIPIQYCVEPQQNIALARNKAVENADGDYIAFIDDDEFATNDWLVTLFRTCTQHGVDGVLGPVKPHFDQQPPRWVVQGRYYDRATYPTGLVIDWRKGRTNNVLLKKSLFTGLPQPFRPEFRTGEDQEFFSRMIDQGHIFIWCNEAIAYEVVPPKRWGRRFMLKRYWLRGAIEPLTPHFGPLDVAKSLLAVALYVMALPMLLVLSHSKFMLYSTKTSFHLGKLLAVVGLNPIKDPYVTT
jgi:glycosyltransferase involved in cell wall biosynthesis